ncbi:MULTISPECIES: ComF family protein [unclassified Adlercreutzia]|uniref:ComF family protein n=1 Tax=unclassified Adlercreutzia TaxID=2636013 RepID=UPI0013EAD2F3|nr:MULTISPECIES: ComF family protein [unclassified Adlercreutzia]
MLEGMAALMRDISPARCLSFASEVLTETLWPTRCAVCDAPGELLCDACAARLPFIDACLACPRCGAPFGRVQCTECNHALLALSGREQMPFDQAASALVLNEAARRIVTTYKDRGERRLCAVMAGVMARYVPPEWTADPARTALTFVPATAAAVRRRGFDHAEQLARSLAALLDLECACVLTRPRNADQRSLSRAQRHANMAGSFAVLAGATLPERVIVIDDVCTTGATLYAAADALREQGARTLQALTFARA